MCFLLGVFGGMAGILCCVCGCGRGFIQGCQQLCLFLLIAMGVFLVGVFLAGVFEGVGGRGFDISSLLLPPSPEAGRPNQLSSAHRQGPGVDTATAGGPPPPPPITVCHKLVYIHLCRQIDLVCCSLRSA